MTYAFRGTRHNGPPVPPDQQITAGCWTTARCPYAIADESRPLKGKSALESNAFNRLRQLEDKGLLKILRLSSVRPTVPNVLWTKNMVDGNRRVDHVPMFPDDVRVRRIKVPELTDDTCEGK